MFKESLSRRGKNNDEVPKKFENPTCGIGGLWIEEAGEEIQSVSGGGSGMSQEERVTKILEALKHRGPDQQTIVTSPDKKFTAGQTRLAIVDAKNTEVKKTMEYQGAILTFNGEIYNHRELRKELEKKGYVFETDTDTEVLLKALVEWGTDVVKRLDGQFAFGFRDQKEKKVILVRDRTGKKPLYFSCDKEKLLYASEPNSIVKEIGFAPNMDAIASLFIDGATFAAGEEPLGESIDQGIVQLKPGEIAIFDEQNQKLSRERYDILAVHDIKEIKMEEEYIFDMQVVMEAAIRKRVTTEVPMGVGLSGGLDSSIVALVAADELAKYGKKLVAACVRYANQTKNDDYEHAAMVVEHAPHKNIEFVATDIAPENFLDHLEEMVGVLGIHDSIRQLAMYENYRVLHEHGVKVSLIGEGADEFNWGYWHRFPGLEKDQEACSTTEGLRLLVMRRVDYVKKLIAPEKLSVVGFEKGMNYLADLYDTFDTTDSTRKMMGVYAVVFLGFLNKANDRLSMAHAIEARAPYQDTRVIETCLNTPREVQIKPHTEKYILREAFKSILPEQVYARPKEAFPAAAHISYHKKIAEEFEKRLASVDASFWEYFNKETWGNMLKSYRCRISELIHEFGETEEAGAQLMRWREVSSDVDIIGHEENGIYKAGKDIQTNDVFKLLTTLVWYQQNVAFKK